MFLKGARSMEGKITIFTSVIGCLVLVGFVTIFNVNVPLATASNVVTSVTVLNTPPTWTVDAQESAQSSTSTPTNAGQSITFVATGTDSSNDNYYLLICKNSTSPTANNGTAPSCNGGVTNQWAVSTSTTSGLQASAATTTTELFAEKNDWWAWICDNNATLSRCNLVSKTGSGLTASPFVVNHPPVFISVANNSPQNPGSNVTWTTVASDSDTIRGSDTVIVVLCKTSGSFNGTTCTTGGEYATSTFAASNPSTSSPIVIPTQDRLYNAFAYVADNLGLAATSTAQGTNSFYQVSNVAPTIVASSIAFIDYNATTSTGSLTLTVASATSGPFKVVFTAVDNNGCQNASSTNEIVSNIINVYRSGISSTSCQTSGQYNSNNCYSAASGNFSPFFNCTQDGGSCSGATDSDATFTCTFSLWFNADPTDAATQFTAESWLATVRATDDNATTSALTEKTVGTTDVISFLAFNVSTSTVAYGALQPGDTTTPLVANTDMQAIGNIGLDEDLYGSTMCTTWVAGGGGTAPDNCDIGGANAATKIPVTQQVVATGTITYTLASASTTLTGALPASTSPRAILLNVPKTTSTSTIQTRNTFWGIAIPSTITQSGSYQGQNTITAKKSSSANW